MPQLVIAPYSAIQEIVRKAKPSHMLTLMVEPFVATPKQIPPERHLRLAVHDIVQQVEGSIAPSASDIEKLLEFGRGWDRSAPFLVHCWAGISRSTAAAYILLCDIHGPGHEDKIAQALRLRAPHAQPNRLMVRHADAALMRNGRMIAAVEAMGEARPLWEAEVVGIPVSLEEL